MQSRADRRPDAAGDGSGDEPGVETDDDRLVTELAHDAHFLSRLERVDFRQADLALRLYRDPELLRAILGDAGLSVAADSIAVPLAEGPAPPHVVIARDRGAFVTCLGAGMHLGATPVLPWSRLAVHLARADALARAGRILGTDNGKDLLRRCITAGPALTREEFTMAAAIQPVLGAVTVRLFTDALDTTRRGARAIVRLKRYRPEYEPVLRGFWEILHAVGHLVLLAASDGHEAVKRWEALLPNGEAFASLTLMPAYMGYLPVAMRALWATARGGKSALVALKEHLAEANDLGSFVTRAAAVTCIGFRHRALRTEAANALAGQRLGPALRDDALAQGWARSFQQMLRGEFIELPEDATERGLVLRLQAAAAFLRAENEGNTPAESDVRDLARADPFFALIANTPVRFHDRTQYIEPLILGASALASQSPEELYYPRAHIDLAPTYAPEISYVLAQFERPPRPVHAEKKIGRNESCPCGSGRKHKRCCGR